MGRADSTFDYLRKQRRLILVFLAALLLLLLCVLMAIILTLTTGDNLIYSVKFVCVPDVSPATVDSEMPFEPAFHRTAINIHNFTGSTIEFTKKAVLARSEDIDRGPVSAKITDVLGPDEALFIDCRDISELLNDQFAGPLFPAGDGFVVIESNAELDIVAVYTGLLVEERVLYKLVTQPFKVRAVKANGSGRDELPGPGDPPFQGFRAEVLNVDFEKTFDMLNKVIYAYEIDPKAPDCLEWDDCAGTREVLIPGPESGVPFPALQGEEGEPNSLEGLIRNLDPSFKKILDVDATMVERDEILQEVTYRWVSAPKKIVVRLQPSVTIDVGDIVEDEDQDGQVDEDPADGVDNDGDGALDEDPPLAPGQEIEIIDTDIGVGQGEDVEREQIAPIRRNALALAVLVVFMVIIVIAILAIVFFLIYPSRPQPHPPPGAPLKALTGFMAVDDQHRKDEGGVATITFQPHNVTGDATLDPASALETGAGADRPYRQPPCVMVSVTKVTDVADQSGYNIEIRDLTEAQVVIKWTTSKDMEIHELRYMVIGESTWG